jgi:hypothetical protein
MRDQRSAIRSVECRLNEGDPWRTGRLIVDRHDIEPHRTPLVEAVSRQIVDRHPDDPSLLMAGDGFGGGAALCSTLAPHLHEDQRHTVVRDDVDFAIPGAIASRKNCVPSSGQLADGEILARFTQCLPFKRHDRRADQNPGHTLEGPRVRGSEGPKVPLQSFTRKR